MLKVGDHFNEMETLAIENGQAGVATIDGVIVTASFRPQSGLTMHFNDEETGDRFFTISGVDADRLDEVAQVVARGIDASRTEARFIDAHDPRHEELYNRTHTPFT
ncbi:MAG: hypothetical protein AAFS01_05480 [Pseudomonadota bacterium]